jgi:hypothetical protein
VDDHSRNTILASTRTATVKSLDCLMLDTETIQ